MAGAFMIALGVLLVLVALSMVLSDKEPDGTTRDGIAGAKRRRSRR
jgi:small neutral amino acid transporter SnatA (MarC family)